MLKTEKLCPRCDRVRNKKKYFSPKKKRSVKTGEILYYSWCKECKLVEAKKKNGNIKCQICGKNHHDPRFNACRSCEFRPNSKETKEQYQSKGKPVKNPYYLRRGLISTNTRTCSISGEA